MNSALTTIDRRLATHRRSGWMPRAMATFTLLVLASPVWAQRGDREMRWRPDDRVFGSLIDVQVLVEGRSAPLYVAPAQLDRRYFEAFRGRRYALRIQNRTGERIGVLIAVDGLNVVNGERTRLHNDEPMYVLGPWESATIRGWRTSLSHVREFVFVDETRSYANRTDQSNGDMGWIRILAFREQPDFTVYRWDDRGRSRLDSDARDRSAGRTDATRPEVEGGSRSQAAQEPLAKAAPPSSEEPRSLDSARQKTQSLDDAFPGTGWGNRRRDRVRRVEFDPVRVASDHVVLRYEYASGLVALGIFPNRDRLHDRDHGDLTFARPPRW